MSIENTKKFIAIVRLGSALIAGSNKKDSGRLREAFLKIAEELRAISGTKPHILFTDSDGITTAFLLKSDLPAGIIRAKLSGDDQHRQPSILLNDDAIVVI